jgi:hypothetical protein
MECEELTSRSDTQFERRAFVRAAFELSESHVVWLSEFVVQSLMAKGQRAGNLSLVHVVLLSGSAYVPNERGKLERWE